MRRLSIAGAMCGVVFLVLSGIGWAQEGHSLTRKKVDDLIGILRKEERLVPRLYGAIYYPRWKEPMDGLKSITAEGIAENAFLQMKKGVMLEVVSEPLMEGDAAVVLLKRSGGNYKEGLFLSYLYRDERNGWGFLGFPVPFKAPLLRGKDGRFMEKALNAPRPYEGPLYEFDGEAKRLFEKLTEKARELKKKVENIER